MVREAVQSVSTHHKQHPPYAQMILSSIVSLKSRKGSSKQAIDGYIKSIYPDLPKTHSSLLSHHLKRLRKSGAVIMVKHSYRLPRFSGNRVTSGRKSEKNTSVVTSPKRGRGRPSKSSFTVADLQENRGRATEKRMVTSSRKREGSLGKSAGPIKSPRRGRGRPSKSTSSNAAKIPSHPPFPSSRDALTPRKRGRPATVAGTDGMKKPRGRPRGLSNSNKTEPKKPRGRPPKTEASRATAGKRIKIHKNESVAEGRPRGRPRGRPPTTLANAISDKRLDQITPRVSPEKKRPRGRPRKKEIAGSESHKKVLEKPSKYSPNGNSRASSLKRPRGRPRKVTQA